VKKVRVAKALIEAYYGRATKYSYFSGCSTGGREALNAAALYGDEYDGVIAAAPSLEMPGVISRWAYAARLNPPSSAKLATLSQAQTVACDGVDGLVDGIISRPSACHFDPASLRCPADQDNASCLTDPEIDVVRTLRSDLTRKNGKPVDPRFGIGNPGTGLGVFMPVAGPGTPLLPGWQLPSVHRVQRPVVRSGDLRRSRMTCGPSSTCWNTPTIFRRTRIGCAGSCATARRSSSGTGRRTR
jgi:hypothetical protein